MPRNYKRKSECTAEEWAEHLAYCRAKYKRNPQAQIRANRNWEAKNPQRNAEIRRNAERRRYWAKQGMPVPAVKSNRGRPRKYQ